MATLFSMSFNLESALKQMGLEVNRAVTRGCVNGINKTAASEKSALGSAVAKDMGIKAGVAKEAIRLERATAASLAARLITTGARIPLIDLNARGPEPSRGRGTGVSYRAQGATKRIPHAFIATVGSGRHRGVFARKTIKRLPIRELFGPSIAHVFEKLVPTGEARRQETLLKNVSHEIEFALSRVA